MADDQKNTGWVAELTKADCWRCFREECERDPAMVIRARFIVCPTCGNKRCPKASDHRLACTASNEPGQKGSIYA